MAIQEIKESMPMAALKKREAEVILLEEGPGNKVRKCWYGVEAIESGKDIFRGAQVYANHPTKTQQTDLPERDIRELVGRIKETYVISDSSTGKKQLRGVLKVLEGDQYDWVLSLIHESLQARKEGFPPVAQVSIHADGDIEKRIIESQEYNYVKNIKSAVSLDIVTKGGVVNAGFTKFVESITGGKVMDRNEERLLQIQKKMAEALNSEDQAFLETLREAEGKQEEADSEEEIEEVFMSEDGKTIVDQEGNEVDPSEVVVADEQGNTADYTEYMDSVNSQEVREPEDEEEVEEQEDMEPIMRASSRGDEVPIAELATRFPHVANEIDQEEMGVEESNRDVDIVKLKMENKLLKSRVIAERKIQESQLPAGFISVDELLGKQPEDMDRLIESRVLMFNNIVTLTESNRPVTMAAEETRKTPANMGHKLLSGAIMPY